MSAVTPAANDELVQVFVVPAHGELHHMMQLRDRNLLGNQQAPPDRRADAPQTDSQLKHGSGLGRIAEHRRTIPAPFGHISRPDFRPPLWRGLSWLGRVVSPKCATETS